MPGLWVPGEFQEVGMEEILLSAIFAEQAGSNSAGVRMRMCVVVAKEY